MVVNLFYLKINKNKNGETIKLNMLRSVFRDFFLLFLKMFTFMQVCILEVVWFISKYISRKRSGTLFEDYTTLRHLLDFLRKLFIKKKKKIENK